VASRGLTLDAVNGICGQLLPTEIQSALDEFGAISYELSSPPQFPNEHFTVVAARGGDDLWVEIRWHRVFEDDRVPEEFFAPPPEEVAPTAAVAVVALPPPAAVPVEAAAAGSLPTPVATYDAVPALVSAVPEPAAQQTEAAFHTAIEAIDEPSPEPVPVVAHAAGVRDAE